MTGTIVNVALILFGGLFFHFRKRELSVENQQLTRLVIVGLVLYSGFRMLWSGLSGGPLHEIGQLGIVFVAMSLGRILGSVLKIQSGLNHMAVFAKQELTRSTERGSNTKSGFLVATGLFCVTPLAVIGGILEGTNGDYHPLVIKAMMDGMATISFARTFGLSVILSAIPVLALQGTITLITKSIFLSVGNPEAIGALTATAGCLIFSVILLVFGIQKIKLGDYLPSLILAPLLAQLWW